MKVRNYLTILCTLVFLVATSQKTKRRITTADYEKWGTLSGESISPDGKWVSYKMEYDNEVDTLFVQSTSNLVRHNFPDASEMTFSPDGKRAIIVDAIQNLLLVDLKTGKPQSFSKIISHTFSADGKHLLLLQNDGAGNQLLLIDQNNTIISQIGNCLHYAENGRNEFAVVTKDGVAIGRFQQNDALNFLILDTINKYGKPIWSKSGTAFAMLMTKSEGKSVVHIDGRKQVNTLEPSHLVLNKELSSIKGSRLVLSDDGSKVFFTAVPNQVEQSNDIVEVWKTSTPLEYPAQKSLEDANANPLLVMWDIDKNRLIPLQDCSSSKSKLLPGETSYLSWTQLPYEPQYEEAGPADYYLNDINSDNNKLVIRRGSVSANAVIPSPDGCYLSYFQNGHYFIYDIDNERTINVSASLETDFYEADKDRPGPNEGYASPGWTNDSRFLILYDKFDIWLVSPNGEMPKRITNGRKEKTQFRIASDLYLDQVGNFGEFARYKFSLKNGLIIKAFGEDKSSGYFSYSESQSLQKIIYKPAKIDRIKKADSRDTYCFILQTNDTPPQIWFLDHASGKMRMLFQSNPHYRNYEWSRSELISYKNAEGKSLHGILMYPAGYKKGIKYPMVTYIYEKLSQDRYEYINPSNRHRIGFIPANYFLDGYFVLMPDITYTVGNPGLSAVDCVTAAVNKVINMGVVDEKRIGLIGHSFGGYEASFIIIQTSLFCAAVAGAGITDLVSWYHTMNFSKQKSNAWALESQQLRMGSTPHDNPEGYRINSPIANAKNVHTPLLSWSGKEDRAVNVEQSIEFHLALRRLKKDNQLLLYPGQGHILTDKAAQKDLTVRIKHWFDRYLKN